MGRPFTNIAHSRLMHVHDSLGPRESSTQTASRSVQPLLQGLQVCDRPTDRPRYSVDNKGRIYVRSTAMRPDNNKGGR